MLSKVEEHKGFYILSYFHLIKTTFHWTNSSPQFKNHFILLYQKIKYNKGLDSPMLYFIDKFTIIDLLFLNFYPYPFSKYKCQDSNY